MLQFDQSNPTLGQIQVQHQEAITQQTLLLASTLTFTLVPSLESWILQRDVELGVLRKAGEEPQA